MGMTDSRSARSTPILSAPSNPAYPTQKNAVLIGPTKPTWAHSQPEAPESQVPHYPEGHRGDIKVRVRVGYKGGTSPGQKRYCLSAINNHTADKNLFGLTSRLLLCFDRLNLG